MKTFIGIFKATQLQQEYYRSWWEQQHNSVGYRSGWNSIAKFCTFSLKLPESFISVYARNKRNLTPIQFVAECVWNEWKILDEMERKRECERYSVGLSGLMPVACKTLCDVRIFCCCASKGHASNWPTNLIIATFSKSYIGRSRRRRRIFFRLFVHGYHQIKRLLDRYYKLFSTTKTLSTNRENNEKEKEKKKIRTVIRFTEHFKKSIRKNRKLFNIDSVDFYPKTTQKNKTKFVWNKQKATALHRIDSV